jgi:hypothetical protein
MLNQLLIIEKRSKRVKALSQRHFIINAVYTRMTLATDINAFVELFPGIVFPVEGTAMEFFRYQVMECQVRVPQA